MAIDALANWHNLNREMLGAIDLRAKWANRYGRCSNVIYCCLLWVSTAVWTAKIRCRSCSTFKAASECKTKFKSVRFENDNVLGSGLFLWWIHCSISIKSNPIQMKYHSVMVWTINVKRPIYPSSGRRYTQTHNTIAAPYTYRVGQRLRQATPKSLHISLATNVASETTRENQNQREPNDNTCSAGPLFVFFEHIQKVVRTSLSRCHSVSV